MTGWEKFYTSILISMSRTLRIVSFQLALCIQKQPFDEKVERNELLFCEFNLCINSKMSDSPAFAGGFYHIIVFYTPYFTNTFIHYFLLLVCSDANGHPHLWCLQETVQ